VNVSVIVEGGLLRAAYVDGAYVEADVFDLDLEGRSEEELQDLLDRIDESWPGSKLRTDLLTWRADVARALSYADGLGA